MGTPVGLSSAAPLLITTSARAVAGVAALEGLGWVGRGILGHCNVFKPGGADRLDTNSTGTTCVFDAFSAQTVVYWRDHPCRHKHCDKLHVPDDLQVLWLDE